MSQDTPRRSLLQRLFKGGLGRPLINLWIEDRHHGYAQCTTHYKLNVGRYCVLQWESIRTDLDAFDKPLSSGHQHPPRHP